MYEVEIRSRRLVLDDFFKIEEAFLRYRRFDGEMSGVVRRLSFERGDSVAALLFNRDRRKFILVRQFKYPTYRKGPGWITETVAGILGDGESPEAAIRREIREEAGYEVERLRPLFTFYLSPGGSSERITLYFAEVTDAGHKGHGGGLKSENEDIETVELALDEALEAVAAGEVQDAKTILAIFWAERHLATEHAVGD